MGVFILFFAVIFWLIYSALKSHATDRAPDRAGFRPARFADVIVEESTLTKELHTKIRGVTFYDRQSIIATKCRAGDLLWLLREPNNPKDINAIQVRRVLTDGQRYQAAEQLGYLSWELAQDLAPLLDSGLQGAAEITQITGHEGCDTEGVNLEIYICGKKSETVTAPKPKRQRTRKKPMSVIVEHSIPNPVLCSQCGKYCLPTAKFCDNCGYAFIAAAQPFTPSPRP